MNNQDLEKVGNQTIEKVEKLKVSIGTIRRLVGFVVTSIIELTGTAWGTSILVDQGIMDKVIGVCTIIAVVTYIGFNSYLYWKNNSWTKEALKADNVMKSLKEGDK